MANSVDPGEMARYSLIWIFTICSYLFWFAGMKGLVKALISTYAIQVCIE